MAFTSYTLFKQSLSNLYPSVTTVYFHFLFQFELLLTVTRVWYFYQCAIVECSTISVTAFCLLFCANLNNGRDGISCPVFYYDKQETLFMYLFIYMFVYLFISLVNFCLLLQHHFPNPPDSLQLWNCLRMRGCLHILITGETIVFSLWWWIQSVFWKDVHSCNFLLWKQICRKLFACSELLLLFLFTTYVRKNNIYTKN